MKMKTTIAVLKTNDWEMKEQNLKGTSAIWLTDDYKQQTTTVKDEVLNTLKKSNLPALFEAEVEAVQKTFNGKSQIKYVIYSLKQVKEFKIF